MSLSGKDRDAMEPEISRPVASRVPGASNAPPARAGRHANTGLVIVFLSLAGLSYAMLQSLVAPALPVMARELRVSTGAISWVLTAYLLAASVATPVMAALGDMFGKRRIMLLALGGLAAGTLLAALATTLPLLITARAVQGVGGAILPLSIGLARDELPPGRVGVTVGLLSAIFGIGAGLGIVLAGPIVDHLSWHWLFWFPLIVIVLAIAGTAAGVPESPVCTPGRIDVLGALLLSAGLVALLLGVDRGGQWGWSAWRTLGLFAGAVVALLAWVAVELKVSHPLVDMRMLRIRGVWAPNIVGLAFGFVLFGSFLLIPQLLELPVATGYGFGKTVTQAGLFLLPLTVAQLVFGPVSGILEGRLGARVPLLLGAILGVAAYVVPAISHAASWLLLLSGALSGIGIGLAQAAMTNAIIESVPPSQTGIATSLNAIVRTIGGSLGSAVLAAILTSHAGPHGIPAEDAFTTGFWICAAVAAGGALAALALPRHLIARTHGKSGESS